MPFPSITINGTNANNKLIGGRDLIQYRVYLNGLGGDDVLEAGRLTEAVIRGGDGNDTITGSNLYDQFLYGDAGNDYIEIVHSNTPEDRHEAYGGAGNDILINSSSWGRVVLDGGRGADTLTGAGGRDVFVVDNVRDVVIEDFRPQWDNEPNPRDEIRASVSYALPSLVENLVLTGTKAISGTGNSASNVLTGNAASNSLFGKGGRDHLLGLEGNDVLEGGAGGDRLDGGVGKDVASYASAAKGVTADLRGVAVNTGEAAEDKFVSIESLIGSKQADKLFGDNLANTLWGRNGNDALDGMGGNDRLLGEGGNDTIRGSTGNDSLYGGAGSDRLNGGSGNNLLDGQAGSDFLTGGAGADVFKFAKGSGRDVITDFQDDLDTISLRGFGLTGPRQALANAEQVGKDVVFDLDGGNTTTVRNASLADLSDDLSF
jgi:Ca2+-binding RTX toxin-like protein